MFKTVREGTRGHAWIDCSATFARRAALPLVILCGLASTTVWAQSGESAHRFQATVMDLSKDSQSISVALNRSVIIQTNLILRAKPFQSIHSTTCLTAWEATTLRKEPADQTTCDLKV